MDKGDLATWFADVVAVGAYAQAWRGTRIAKRAQDFAEETRTDEQWRADADARRISWKPERQSKNLVVLRNDTDNEVLGLSIGPDQFDGLARDLPDGVDVPPHGSVEFMVMPSFGGRLPHEFRVTWADGEAMVRLPPWP
jgi:hypothetical protein